MMNSINIQKKLRIIIYKNLLNFDNDDDEFCNNRKKKKEQYRKHLLSIVYL
jgi:hypothetical protein